jgi:hypothetical protein
MSAKDISVKLPFPIVLAVDDAAEVARGHMATDHS